MDSLTLYTNKLLASISEINICSFYMTAKIKKSSGSFSKIGAFLQNC